MNAMLPPAFDRTDSSPFTHVLNEELRILVVDDDPIQREFASVYLASPHAEIFSAASAEQGIERLQAESFDLVIVDYEMPGMNGVQFVRKVKADPKLAQIPIVMVTSHEDIATIDAAFHAGATSFAVKPVNWRLLSYQIKFVLRAHRLMQKELAHG